MNRDFSVIVLTLRPYILTCIFNQNQKQSLSLEYSYDQKY